MGDIGKRTRLVSQIKRAAAFTATAELDQCTIGEIDARCARLQTWYGDLDETYSEIMNNLAPDLNANDRKLQEDVFFEAEINYFTAFGRYNDRKRALEDGELRARAAALESLARSQRETLNNSTATELQTNTSANGEQNVAERAAADAVMTAQTIAANNLGNTATNTNDSGPTSEASFALPGNFVMQGNNRNLGLRLKDQELPKFNGDPHST